MNTEDIRVGIEVELENFVGMDAGNKWEVVPEAMLINGAEYVLRKPLKGKVLDKAIDDLFDKLTTEVFSQRCGTHIHIDIQDMSEVQLFNFITLYVVFEPLILTLLQKERVGNCFAVPVKDSYGIEDMLIECATGREDLRDLGLGQAKYGAINLASIGRLGSLEFRSFHGTNNKHELRRWISVYTKLKAYAMNKDITPIDIVTSISVHSAKWLLEDTKLSEINSLSANNYEELIHDGMRNAQFFAFSGDWI